MTAKEIGRSTAFFPLVGFCLGFVLVILNRILGPYLESEILGVVLVSFLILFSRAQHLQGLGETVDQISSRGDGGDESGSRLGISGILAVVVVIMLKFRAVEVMGELRDQALLIAPVLGRWSMVILAYCSRAYLHQGGEQVFQGEVRGWQLLWATALALAVVIFAGGSLGLWSALWVSLLALVVGWYLHRHPAGEGGDPFGAIAEVSEALVMVLFASL